MHQVTCKNCNKDFDGIMGQCGGSNTCTIYRCPHCQNEEIVESEPIDWSKALVDTKLSNNIALGYKAGCDLTTEKFQLCIKLEGFDEMRTTMTQKEHEVMAGLVKRLFGKAQEK